jgi:hypothetical protein
MGDIDHISDATHGVRHRDMIDMNSRQGVGHDWRAKQVIGLKIADRFPQRGEQRRSRL